MLYILLPLSFIGALFLCSQGVVQTLGPWQKAATTGRRHTDDSAWPGGVAGADQASQFGWRRLL